MNQLHSDIRLTDELERQLMQAAIEDQMRIKPGKVLKSLFVKLGGKAVKAAPGKGQNGGAFGSAA